MRVFTNEQLNDPQLFNKPEYDSEKAESYQRALAFCTELIASKKG